MTRYDTPGYYAVVDDPDAVTMLNNYVEGRIFLNEKTLVCGAGRVNGYSSTVDEYSESSLRMLFGGKYDPQQFGYETAQTRDKTITVEINAISDVKFIKWAKGESGRSTETYGILLSAPSTLSGELIIRLGKGDQNRGAGKTRHIAFARALNDRNTTEVLEATSPDVSSESEGGSIDSQSRQKETADVDNESYRSKSGTQHESSNPPDTGHADQDGNTNTPIAHPVIGVSEEITSETRVSDPLAGELCRALSADSPDKQRIESALSDVIDRLEHANAVTDIVAGLEKSTDEQQIESMRRSLAALDGPIADSLGPALAELRDVEAEYEDRDSTVTSRPGRGQDNPRKIEELQSEIDEYRQRYNRIKTAAGGVCQDAARVETITFQSSDTEDRLVELVDALESGDIVFDSPGRSLTTIVEEVKRSARPQTTQSRDLLNALSGSNWADDEISAVLESTVTTVDKFAEPQAAIADIQIADVRRRLNSLDDELKRQEDPVYRHLADRVREMEAMVDEGIDDVQLYAIYQECTFYDRTLVPRLSRSNSSQENIDVLARAREIDDRITSVNDEYVSVKVDYNHTIPTHFLNLANALCDQARQISDQQPQRAVGQLAAASELLDHVEELYERNEYSVMLRRLRG